MEQESVDINYKKGFNHGCYLSQDPGFEELLNGIKNKETSYYKALLAGKKQRERENFLNQLKETNTSKDQSKDSGRDY